jgi:hypothetical protein
MNDRIDELITVLTKEVEAHRLLIAAASGMNAALRKGDLAAVQTAGRQYDECICRIQEMEEKRLELCDGICNRTDTAAGHASLLAAIDAADPGCKNRLIDLRLQLREAVNDLSKVNYSNQVLCQESLVSIAKTFEMMATQETTRYSGYKKQGTRDVVRGSRRIINAVA